MRRTREEYVELMTFNSEQPMFSELFGLLVGLDKEWHAQGATKEEIELIAWDWDYVPVTLCGGNMGLMNPLSPVILEDNEDFCIRTNEYGVKEKLCKKSVSVYHPIEWSVKTMDDWLKIKPKFTYSAGRIDWEHVAAAKKLQEKGVLVKAMMPGGFNMPRMLLGEEGLCYAYYDEPEMIQDMIDTITDTSMKVLDRISEKLTIDNLNAHEDMAGKSGSLIGPDLINKYMKPYYKKVWEMLSSKGTRIFSQDSDGNMNSVIDTFLECGINVMYPFEPAADMDIVQLRKIYGNRVAFKGGIDKHVLRQDKEAIRKELEYKMQPFMQKGGIVFGLDHRIPNGTPLENYRYYVDTGREILGLPPRNVSNNEWQRMAF